MEPNKAAQLELTTAYNEVRFEPANWTTNYLVLVSQVIGDAVHIPWKDAVVLYVLVTQGDNSRKDRLEEVMRDDAIMRCKPADIETSLDEMMAFSDIFVEKRLPRYLQYEIVRQLES